MRIRLITKLTAVAAAGLVLAAAPHVYAQSARDMQNRISRLENEIQTLSRAVYRGEMPSDAASRGGGSGANAQESARIEVRLSQLESEVRNLTGELERHSYKISQLEQKIDGISGTSGAARGVTRAQPFTRAQADRSANDSAPPLNNSGYGGSNRDGIDEDMPEPEELRDPDAGAKIDTLGSIRKKNGEIVPDDMDPARAYQRAFSMLRQKNYDDAEKAFQAFLDENPEHKLANNARYWLGETYYVRGNYERAARTFASAYQRDPGGSKAADNLLKLGMSLAGMDNTEDACVTLQQLVNKYNDAPPAILDRARGEIKDLGCGG